MATTPAKKTASKAKAKTAERPKGNNLYLAALPKGWTFDQIVATGPDGERIEMLAKTDGVTVTFETGDIKRTTITTDMAEAGKAAAKGARMLDEVAKKEAALKELRDDGFANLGQAADEPTPDADPAS